MAGKQSGKPFLEQVTEAPVYGNAVLPGHRCQELCQDANSHRIPVKVFVAGPDPEPIAHCQPAYLNLTKCQGGSPDRALPFAVM